MENAVSMHIQEPVRNVWVWDEKIATRFLNCDPFFLSSCSTYAHPYMGEHLSPSGGRDLENFLRGIKCRLTGYFTTKYDCLVKSKQF